MPAKLARPQLLPTDVNENKTKQDGEDSELPAASKHRRTDQSSEQQRPRYSDVQSRISHLAMELKQTGFGSNCYKLGGGRRMSTSLLLTVFLGGNLSPGLSPLKVVAAKSRWTVRLHECFQDAANIYLVMDHMVGGGFSSILREVEMILGVQEVYMLGWIHRPGIIKIAFVQTSRATANNSPYNT
jgi:hypothetical protein